jgi:hypothetical protein
MKMKGTARPVWRTSLMIIADLRLETAHFTETGQCLGGSVSSSTSTQPTCLPNKDYIRLGGRIGAAIKYMPPWDQSTQNKEWTVSTYYRNFAALAGVRHRDLGERYSISRCPLRAHFQSL